MNIIIRDDQGLDTALMMDGYSKEQRSEARKPKCEGSYDIIGYPYLSTKKNQAILNPTSLEHLLWNVSHEMLEYTNAGNDAHGCNERTKQHNSHRPWKELDDKGRTVSQQEGWKDDYKTFGFGVVDVTIWLNINCQ